MQLGERIRRARKERGWSQAELAEQINSDARQISRYEKGHITPSTEVIVKIAEVLEVSTDYLLLESGPMRQLRVEDRDFLARFQDLQSLTDKDREAVLHIVDALVTRNKVRSLASNMAPP